jgi:hypothetical protein
VLILSILKEAKENWKYNRLIKIPSLVFQWRYLDFRPWYYVWVGGEKMLWWAHGNELDELKEEYRKDICFEKVPWRKSLLK